MQDRRCIYFNQPHLWRSGLAYCFKTGGSICHQIPNSPVCRAIYYSDVATALIAYEAEVEYIEDGETHRTDLKSLIERHSVANGLACQKLVCDLVTTRLPRSYQFDPVKDIQVLCPTKLGPTGTQALNAELQAMLNPPKKGKPEQATAVLFQTLPHKGQDLCISISWRVSHATAPWQRFPLLAPPCRAGDKKPAAPRAVRPYSLDSFVYLKHRQERRSDYTCAVYIAQVDRGQERLALSLPPATRSTGHIPYTAEMAQLALLMCYQPASCNRQYSCGKIALVQDHTLPNKRASDADRIRTSPTVYLCHL